MSTKFCLETDKHWWRFDTEEEAKAFQSELSCPSVITEEIDNDSYFMYNEVTEEVHESRG